MLFTDLPLAEPILRAAADVGYTEPSPIQEQAIPPVAAGRDLLGCAQTGTGKTAAFAMPILQRLAAEKPQHCPIRALILTPTRELAIQIDDSFEAYGKYMPLRHTVIFGGVGQNPQVAALKKGVDILTATPGRLNDLIGQGFIKLDKLEIFVLDEADRMLDMGFIHDVCKVLKCLPTKRQTLLFSATMPKEIQQLADGLLHDPVKVMVTPPATTVEKIDQSLYFVDKPNKRFLLAQLIRDKKMNSVLVFTRTKHGADRVVRELKRDGIEGMAIHGNKSQNARQDALAKFKDGTIRVLVATDIAARGIDIAQLPFVVNYDLPNIPETYVHRIGRTGRAGQEGVAISFCMEDEIPYLKDIEKLIKLPIPVIKDHAWPMQGNAAVAAARAAQEQAAPQPKNGRKAAKPASKAAAAKPARQLKQQAPPAPKAKEEKDMEQNRPTTQADGEGAVRKRRHRGGRGRRKNGAAQQQPAAQQGNAQQSATQQPAAQQSARTENAQARPAQAQRNQQRPSDTRRNSERNGERRAKPNTEDTNIHVNLDTADVGPELISRRAPAQKYASFADYMQDHGGFTKTQDDKDTEE